MLGEIQNTSVTDTFMFKYLDWVNSQLKKTLKSQAHELLSRLPWENRIIREVIQWYTRGIGIAFQDDL